MIRRQPSPRVVTLAALLAAATCACQSSSTPSADAGITCSSTIDAGGYTLTVLCPEDGGAAACDPHAQIEGGPAFSETTADWGLTGLSFGNIYSVDLDNDGYPDLVGCGGGARQTIPTASADGGLENQPDGGFQQLVAVLMNRPKPGGGRTFVDATAESGLFQVRGGSTTQYREADVMAFADVNNDGYIDAFSAIAFAAPNYPPLPAMLPADQNEILLNDGHGHFTLAAPSATNQLVQPGLNQSVFTDIDNDGNLDLFLTYWTPTEDGDEALVGSQAQLLTGAGDGTFALSTPSGMMTDDKDVSLSSQGINATVANIVAGTNPRPSFGATACDLNGDGYPELLISSYGGQSNQLYVNDGTGNYTRQINGNGGFDGDSNVDYSDNWYYECYCVDPTTKDTPYCAGAGQPPICCQGTCSNDPTTTCTWDPTNCGGACPTGGTCVGIAANIESIGGWHPGLSDQPAVLNGNNFGATCRDVNGDGVPDIWEGTIHHEWAGQSTDSSALLLNTTPQNGPGAPISWNRVDNATVGIVLPHWDYPSGGGWSPQGWNEGVEQNDVADLDNDGYPDILAPESDYAYQYLHIYKQLPNLQFQDEAFAWGLVVPCMSLDVVADFDRRGSLALLENEAGYNQCGACGTGQTQSSETCGGWPASGPAPAFNGGYASSAVHMFGSNAGQSSSWLAIRLRAGAGTNAMAFGARVTVMANGVSQMQDMLGGKVIASRSDDPGVLFFGLGGCGVVNSVTVRWPNKGLTVETWKNVPANKLIELHAADSAIYGVNL
jgi:enediyne biosynthesis protein E4